MKHDRRTYSAFVTLLCVACAQPPLDSAPETDTTTREGFALNDLDCRWPNNTIRYNFYDTWGDEHVPQATRATFADAVAYLEERLPLNFYEIYNTDGDYLMVYREPDDDHYSHAEVGFQGGETEIHLKNGIDMLGVVHELGHNLGMRHEHQRTDRDNFVTVVYENIDSDDHDNFDIEDPDDHWRLTPYDHHSAMHYGEKNQCIKTIDFSMSPPQAVCQTTTSLTSDGILTTDKTMQAKTGVDTAPDVPGLQTEIKTSRHLSKHDLNALWLMYARTLSIPLPDERLGESMVVADFDMDGYNDIAIGAPYEVGDDGLVSGAVFVFKGTERLPVPWRLLHHGQLGARGNADNFGAALAVGDFNGDDFPDLAVGAPGARSPAGITSGTVTLFRGGQFAGANAQPGGTPSVCSAKCGQTSWAPLEPWRVLSGGSLNGVTEASTDRYGTSVGAGDGDADGMDELIVGAPLAASNYGTGQAYFYRGSSLASSGPVSGSALSTYSIGTARFHFGGSVTSGDFDGDGKADLAIGAPGSREQVFVFCGRGRRVFEAEQRIDSAPGLDAFGASLTAGELLANDMMGDALVIGAPQSLNASGTRTGRVHVLGREGGVGSCAVYPFRIVDGVTQNEHYGHATLVTDFDLDGVNDLLVGAPNAGTGRVQRVRSTGANLIPNADLAPPTNAAAFGSSLAAGVVKIDPMPFAPDGLATAPMRIFVGAPESESPFYPMNAIAGAAFGFSTDATGTLVRAHLYQNTDSPFSK